MKKLKSIINGIFRQPKKVGLVLGGGAARGMAHIGVIKVLVENKIPIHYIAGTSSGALFGALFSGGMNPYDMAKKARETDWLKLVRVKISASGPITGEGIERLIIDCIGNKNIQDLRIPLAVVATDIKTGEKVIITKGNIAKAVHASSAIPGIFSPVQFDGKLLVDGLVVDNLPVSTVKEMGADFIIAVDVIPKVKLDQWEPNVLSVIERSVDISCREHSNMEKSHADIIIDPVDKNYSGLSLNEAEKFVKMGEIAALKALPKIKSLLKIP
jgi:NTE family protein